MQKSTLFGISMLLIGALGCGDGRTSASLFQAPGETESVAVINGKLGSVPVALDASVPLDDVVVNNQHGWLLMSWVSAESGSGTLSFPIQGKMQNGIQLIFSPGKSVLLMSSFSDVYRYGQVSGTQKVSCGPQGQACQQAIPEIRPEQLSFPCGPQGAKCKIVLP